MSDGSIKQRRQALMAAKAITTGRNYSESDVDILAADYVRISVENEGLQREVFEVNHCIDVENERLREHLKSVSDEIHRQIRLCEVALANPRWTARAEHTIDTLARVLAKLEPRPPEHEGTDDTH